MYTPPCLLPCYILSCPQTCTDKFPAHSGFQYLFLPTPHDFQDSWKPSSALKLGHCQLLTLNTIYSKVSTLVLLQPCHHLPPIHVYFAFIVFLPTSCLSPTSHPLHPLHLCFP